MSILDHIKQNVRRGEIEFFIEVRSKELAKSRMPVTKGILNPYGIVQAGALLWLADVTASILIMENTEINSEGKGFPLAINLNAPLLGNIREGEITAEARFVRNGRRIQVVRTRVMGPDSKLLTEVTTTHVPAD